METAFLGRHIYILVRSYIVFFTRTSYPRKEHLAKLFTNIFVLEKKKTNTFVFSFCSMISCFPTDELK